MFRDESEAIDLDRLDRALNALADGGSSAAEPWLDATDLRLRALDTAFAPGEGVLMRVWEGLVEEAPASVVTSSAANGTIAYPPPRDWRVVYRWFGRRVGFAGGAVLGPGGHGDPPLHGHVQDEESGPWWRRWGMGEASTVTLVVLVVIAGYAAMRLAGIGGSDGDEVGPGGFAATVASEELIVPSPEECTVELLTWQEVEAIASAQAAGPSPPRESSRPEAGVMHQLRFARVDGLLEVTGGAPADAATVAEVGQTLHMYIACLNAGNIARKFALYSEEIVGVIGTLSGEEAASLQAEYEATPVAALPDRRIGFFPLTEARVLDTGHVVVLQPVNRSWLLPTDDGIQADPDDPYLLFVFEHIDGRWLIDGFQVVEADELLGQPLMFPPTPTAAMPTMTPASVVVEVPTSIDVEIVPTVVPRTPPTLVPITPVPAATPSVVVVEGGAVAETIPVGGLPSIEQEPIVILVEVDAEGVLAGDPGAMAEAREALREKLADLPAECRVWFAVTVGHAENISDGSTLARTVNDLLREEFPALFSTAASETHAYVEQPYGKDEQPYGKIELRLYVSAGCREAATVQPTPTNAAFRPTHQSNSAQQVNLRAGPSTTSDFVKVLVLAEPLQYLNEDEPADDPSRDGPRWMKFRTEDGYVGWVREIDVEPIDEPMPTPAM